ncbi:MAG: DNA cytosine methyltransferase [Bifidobacteriaceae bacterium]|nr:DNA cytosine methyltransferase [Bifidobacteriaceae bacterium]
MTNGNPGRRLTCGSLFSGYGGLDLAVEEVFDAETIWFAETDPAAARVYSSHWPGIPNLGDVTAVDWGQVEPVDVLCGGFPCQDLSEAGVGRGLAPGTRSGLWAEMATAISVLRPSWVVAENVRGLLSAPAAPTPAQPEPGGGREPTGTGAVRGFGTSLWGVADLPGRPQRAMGAVLADLARLRYDTQWVGLPASTVGAPHPRFRIFILARTAVQDPNGL